VAGKIFGLNEGELLLIGIAGFYIARGIKKVADFPAQAAASASTSAQNTVYGITNTSGITNITAIQNASDPTQTGIMWGTSPSYSGNYLADLYNKLTTSDWLTGIHLW